MPNKNKIIFSLLAVMIGALLAGCSIFPTADVEEEQRPTQEIDESTDTPGEITDIESGADIAAKYEIKFIADWSSETHPDLYPPGAHFSPFVAYSHDDSLNGKIFNVGEIPSPGIEEMAETGATKILINEIQNIIESNSAHAQTKGSVFNSPGSDSSMLELTQDHSNVTFVSMLAPSPDWFVGNTINLFKNGKWVESTSLDLITYDAGGDSGERLTSPDQDTNPKEPITIFNDNLQHLGSIVLVRIFE